jgi:hypothetical protein
MSSKTYQAAGRPDERLKPYAGRREADTANDGLSGIGLPAEAERGCVKHRSGITLFVDTAWRLSMKRFVEGEDRRQGVLLPAVLGARRSPGNRPPLGEFG